MAKREYNTVDERQSYVQKSGEDWENKVMDFVNYQFKRLGSRLVVIKGKTIKKTSKLWNRLSIPAGKSSSLQKIWGN